MSPNEQKMTSGRAAIAMRPVDHLQRGDADRAARAVDQLDARREQLVDAVLDDRVGLAAADLHQRPRPGRDPGDRREQLLAGQRRVAVLVEVLHGAWPPRAGRPASEPRSSGLVELLHLVAALERPRASASSTVRDGEPDVDET